MNRGLIALAVVVVLVGGALFSGCGTYNRLTTQEVDVNRQWSEIDNALQRRHDLIPNLVETTKGFAQQEKDVIASVTEARTKYAGATTPADKMAAANAESSAIARLLVVMENYPQLKSDAVFMNLMTELAGAENRISTARRRYNEATQVYDTSRRRFPSNIWAGLFGFQAHPFFEAAEGAKTVPTVDFKKK